AWTSSEATRAITGRARGGLAAALLMVGSVVPVSLPSQAESGQRQIRAGQPRVSPDGRRIAFVARMAGRKSGLYLGDCDGNNVHRLTNGYGDMPAWSPDGSKLLFVRSEGHKDEDPQSLVVIDSDGTGEHVINTGQKKNQSPSFSPDGKQIVLSLDGEIGF